MNRSAVAFVCCALFVLAFAPSGVRATVPIAEWGDGQGRFDLAGYARLITGYHDLGYGAPLLREQRGLTMGVGRLEWSAEFGPDVRARVHNDLTWNTQTTGAGTGGGSLFGVDASRAGDRTVDLGTTFVERNGMRLSHDVDRLAVDIYTDAADVTLGRQGITWGTSVVFPVADLWSRFSPFDFDTEQKPGIDAARALVYPNLSSELDLVVADRGSLADLSGGARYASTIGRTELYGAAGKFWDELLALAGVTVVFDRVKLRAEAVGPFDLEDSEVDLPRATGGGEWYGADFSLGGEYHFNGIGAADPTGYADRLSSEQFARGESYFLGRHYAALYGAYRGVPDLELSLSTIANLVDPSLIVTPSLRYSVAQNATIGVGALVSAGDEPSLAPTPSFGSEFGTYGDFYFVELAAFY